jgi:hypothetical protein
MGQKERCRLRRTAGGRFICECGFEGRNGMPCQHQLAAIMRTDRDLLPYFNWFWEREYERGFREQIEHLVD